MELLKLIKNYNKNPQCCYIIEVDIMNDYYYDSYRKEDAYTRISISIYEKELVNTVRNIIINYQEIENMPFIEENGTRSIIKEEYRKYEDEKYEENKRLCERIDELERQMRELGGGVAINGLIYPEVQIPKEWYRNAEYTDFIIKCFPSSKLFKELERYQSIQKID